MDLNDIFSSMILHEAVPRKSKELNIKPDVPPDLNNPDKRIPTQDMQQQEPPPEQQQQDQQAPPPEEQQPPADDANMDASGAAPEGGDTETPPDMAGGAEDPNAVAGDDAQGQEDQQAADQQGAEADAAAPQQDDEQQAEQEIFANLKPEQQEIMKRELKDRFVEVYRMVIDTMDHLNKITKTAYDKSMIDFIVRKLLEIKDISRDSLLYAYDTRTYIENKVVLQKLLSVYTEITQMVEQIYGSRMKRAEIARKKVGKVSNDNIFRLDDFIQDVSW